jgi:hypothetical protein
MAELVTSGLFEEPDDRSTPNPLGRCPVCQNEFATYHGATVVVRCVGCGADAPPDVVEKWRALSTKEVLAGPPAAEVPAATVPEEVAGNTAGQEPMPPGADALLIPPAAIAELCGKLTRRQRRILAKLKEYDATSEDGGVTRQGVVGALGERWIVDSWKGEFAELKQLDLTDSKAGQKGRIWLTPKGIEVAARLATE